MKIKWTPEKIQNEADKYTTRSEWEKNSPKSYGATSNHGGIDKYAGHMIAKKIEIKWTPALIQVEADKYTTRSEWKTGSPNSYVASYRYGGIDKYAGHMIAQHVDWTAALIQAEADKYTTRGGWQTNSKNSYGAAYKLGNIDKYAKHMIDKLTYWTHELIQAEADKYS